MFLFMVFILNKIPEFREVKSTPPANNNNEILTFYSYPKSNFFPQIAAQ